MPGRIHDVHLAITFEATPCGQLGANVDGMLMEKNEQAQLLSPDLHLLSGAAGNRTQPRNGLDLGKCGS